MYQSKSLLASLTGVGMLLSVASAHAVSFSASEIISGYNYAASADFTFDSGTNTLSILLKNTAPDPAANQGQTLSGIYFDVAGNPVLLKGAAQTGSGSSIVNDSPNLNDSKIGQEWAFRNNIGAAEASFTDARYGISATGLNIFGPGDRFDTSGNLVGPASVGGDDFNIVPAVQSSFTSGGLSGRPFVQSSMVFTLLTPGGFSFTPDSISNVAFHYGSGQEYPTIVGEMPNFSNSVGAVPEPGTIALLVAMAPLSVCLARRQRRLRRNRANG